MKFFAVLALAAVAVADNPAPVYAPAPAYAPAPRYAPAPSYKPAPKYEEPAVYAYSYQVADDHYGPQFNAEESRDGYATSGSYRVNLPDGRVQIVSYKVADAYSGYVADVSYEGEAVYPEEPAYKPAPKYAPAPSYKPAPAYAPAN